ncbi:MAG: hypothetical protein WAT70_10075 [Rhizobiaceae bacterium]
MRRGKFASFLAGTSGSAGVTFVVLSAVVSAAIALGIETARLGSSRTFMQDVGDSAAIYGATLVRDGESNDATVTQKVRSWMAAQLTGGNVTFAEEDIAVTVDRVRGAVRVEARVEQELLLPFLRPSGAVALTTITEAGVESTAASAGLCGLALNESAQKAMHFKGDGDVSADDCVFWSNSRDKEATHGFGDGAADTSQVCSVGRYSRTGTFSIQPPPEDNCAAQPDPYASWSAPKADWSRCDFGPSPPPEVDGGGYDVTLSPGVYCGGLKVGSARDVVFKPGRYFFDGKSNIVAAGRIVGDGVYLHFAADSEADFRADTIELKRIADPALAFVLVHAPAGADKPSIFNFEARSDFETEGVFYLPADELTFKIARAPGAPAFGFGAIAQLVAFDTDKGDTFAFRPLIRFANGKPALSDTAAIRLLR